MKKKITAFTVIFFTICLMSLAKENTFVDELTDEILKKDEIIIHRSPPKDGIYRLGTGVTIKYIAPPLWLRDGLRTVEKKGVISFVPMMQQLDRKRYWPNYPLNYRLL